MKVYITDGDLSTSIDFPSPKEHVAAGPFSGLKYAFSVILKLCLKLISKKIIRRQHITRRFLRPFSNCSNFLATLCSFLPVLDWLPQYAWGRDFLADLIAGLTIGVMHVPQGKLTNFGLF